MHAAYLAKSHAGTIALEVNKHPHTPLTLTHIRSINDACENIKYAIALVDSDSNCNDWIKYPPIIRSAFHCVALDDRAAERT